MGGLSVVTDQVWSFHPATNTWKEEIVFPGSNRRFPVAFAIHNRGYYGTGTNGINFNDFWQFNPTDNTIGIDEPASAFKVQVYPNPFSDHVCVTTQNLYSTKDAQISVYDMNGKLFLEVPYNYFQQNIDLSSLNPGTYFMQIRSSDQIIYQEKLIKR